MTTMTAAKVFEDYLEPENGLGYDDQKISETEMLVTEKSLQDVMMDIASRPGQEEPFYLLNTDDLIHKVDVWRELMPKVEIFYAVKCNDNQTVVKTMANLGTGFDCASKKEIEQVTGLGVSPSRIIYAHPCKSESDLRFASKVKLPLMTFDCEEELVKVKKCFPEAELVLRIRCDSTKALGTFGEKFGASLDDSRKLLGKAKDLGLKIVGVSFHVGTGCQEIEAYSRGIAAAKQLFEEAEDLGMKLTLLDIGGGFPDSIGDLFSSLASAINSALDEYFPPSFCKGLKILAEPGRYIVSTAFTLATSIRAKKSVEDGGQVIKMYHLNDGIYGSFLSQFRMKRFCVKPPQTKETKPSTQQITVWGPTCSELDEVNKDSQTPCMEHDGWLYWPEMGAYGHTMDTFFNGFPKATVHTMASPEIWDMLNQGGTKSGIMGQKTSDRTTKNDFSSPKSPENEPKDNSNTKEGIIITEKSSEEIVKEIISQPERNGPFYLLDLGKVVHNVNMWRNLLSRVDIFYTVACNDSQTLLKTLSTLGLGFVCGSKKEIRHVTGLGIKPSRVIYGHPCKSESDLKCASRTGVRLMAFDSEEELMKVKKFSPEAELVLRIHCAILKEPFAKKFGVSLKDSKGLLNRAKELGLSVVGVSFHVGTGCQDATAYHQGIATAKKVFGEAEELGMKLTILDIGGGFPGRISDGFDTFASVINSALDEFFPPSVYSELKIIAEPGRYIAQSAFTLAAHIMGRKFLYGDDGIVKNYYTNKGMYNHFLTHYLLDERFSPKVLKMKGLRGKPKPSMLWGPTSSTSDIVMKDIIDLPELECGDWLYWSDTGAYTLVFVTSFNGFPSPTVHPMASPKTWSRLQGNLTTSVINSTSHSQFH